MTGISVTILVICLGMITLGSLAVLSLVVWWTMDSAGRHSTSARVQQRQALETNRLMVGEVTRVALAQMEMTELLLLGRPMQPTSQPAEMPEPSETNWTPDDLLRGLPDTIMENLVREKEEAGTWLSQSEQLANGFDPADPPEDLTPEARAWFESQMPSVSTPGQ